MNIKRVPAQALLLAILLTCGHLAQAQVYANDAEWKETEAPPPPGFDMSKLIRFDVPTSQSLVYGVDPASISISKSDSLVRYVMVATSASGARNVMYEALRCSTGEFKTYARYSSDGKWSLISDPQWRSVFENMPSKHAVMFARAGACDAAAPVGSVKELVIKLKNPGRYMDQ
jgi:CNP1-like family